MKKVAKITGRQGAWKAEVQYSDGSVETLPCVHDRYWMSGNHYHDAWDEPRARIARRKPQFLQHIEMLRTAQRVVVARNIFHGERAPTRFGYRGVFKIENFTFSETDGVRFTFAGGIPAQD